VKSKLKTVQAKLKRQGSLATLHEFSMRALNAAVFFKILRGVYVERPDPAFLACPERYSAGFLDHQALARYAQQPETELSETFVEQNASRGDRCFALRDGEVLSAYGWYSSRPTPIGIAGLEIQFIPQYVYMYKGFTDHRYRGQRLHAIGMTMALNECLRAGYKGIVSYVESTNADSLKSCFRMGYRVFGSAYLVRIFGRYFSFYSPGCKKFAFCVVDTGNSTPLVFRKAG
jgi:hypothetical protein